jgi:hypothetical protein
MQLPTTTFDPFELARREHAQEIHHQIESR